MANVFGTEVESNEVSGLGSPGKQTSGKKTNVVSGKQLSSLDTSVKVGTDSGSSLGGNSFKIVDPRKFKYDVVAGSSRRAPVQVTRNDRMTPEEAGALLNEIHKIFGIDKDDEGVLVSFDHGLFLCIALNSSSTLSPGRAYVLVKGKLKLFPFEEIRLKLDINFRRFARTFADEIRDALKYELARYDPNDLDSVATCESIKAIAFDRGMHRFPYLMFDTAEACTKLSLAERMAVNVSKTQYLDTVNNAADIPLKDRK